DAVEREERPDVKDADPPDADHAHVEAVTGGRHGSAYSKRLHDSVSSPRTRPRRVRRASDDEPWLEQVAALLHPLPVGHVEQELSRALGDLPCRLVDG